VPLEGAFLFDDRKITGYLLSHADAHRAAKARFFESFGFSSGNVDLFRDALLEHPTRNEIVSSEDTEFGRKFTLSCTISTPDGRNPCIQTVWLSDPLQTSFRFVTAVPRPTRKLVVGRADEGEGSL
jgi:hypothetical protein